MKLRSLFFLFIILISDSCDEEYCYINICDWDGYTSQSILNGNEQWTANRVWVVELNSGNTAVIIDFVNEFEELRERISLREFNLKTGDISLHTMTGIFEIDDGKPTAYYSTYTADGDAVTGFYVLFENQEQPNKMAITRISEDLTEIEGTYQLSFIEDVKADSLMPDTLIFTDGVFKARTLD